MDTNNKFHNGILTMEEFNNIIKLDIKNKGEISDGYHTFNELYDFRMIYNAALFNEWAEPWRYNRKLIEQGWMVDGDYINSGKYNVHKSWKHSDGEWCFGTEKEWFIVSAKLPTGLISNHYKAEYWDLFKIPETEKALFKYDGHTSQDVLERLKNFFSL